MGADRDTRKEQGAPLSPGLPAGGRFVRMKTSRRVILVPVLLAASLVAAPSASAQVAASPSAVQFGKQARNTTSNPRTFQVFNPTATTQVVPGDVTVPPFTFDAPGNGTAMALAPNQSVTVIVTFRPTALGQVVRTVNYSGTPVSAIGTGTARNEIDGTDGDDTLTGTSGDDVITCGKGNDKVDAGGGDDVIRCGEGNDIIKGGSGRDRIDAGAGADRAGGGSGNDRVAGGAGKDKLFGDSGNDTLIGGAGRDILRGGSGSDRLVGPGDKRIQ